MKKLKLFSLLMLLFVGVTSMWATDYYVKVTKTADITDGDYLIVYEGDATHDAVALNGGLTTIDAAENGIAVTIAEGKIEANATTNAAKFTISVSGKSIKSASGKYIGVSSNSNGLKQEDTLKDYGNNSFTIESSAAKIASSAGPTLRYNYASDNLRFRYYKSGQQAIQLYKFESASSEPTV